MSKFVKKTALLSVTLGEEFEMFELSGPQGQSILITDDANELLTFLRSDSSSANSAN